MHEADIIQSIDVMIHKLTVQLDEHTFNAHAMVNRAESIYHHMKENKKLDRMLDQTIRTAAMTIDRSPLTQDDQIIAVGKVEADAQRYVKVQVVRLTQDLCELEVPLRNRAQMTHLVETYKEQ